MVELHSVVGVLVIAVNVVAALIGLVYFVRRREPARTYLHLVALGQVVVVAQAAVGLLLLAGDFRAPDKLHYVYGGVALAAILSPWMYAPPSARKRLLWFVCASAVAAALGARGYMTGS
jgi:hypothetical protein